MPLTGTIEPAAPHCCRGLCSGAEKTTKNGMDIYNLDALISFNDIKSADAIRLLLRHGAPPNRPGKRGQRLQRSMDPRSPGAPVSLLAMPRHAMQVSFLRFGHPAPRPLPCPAKPGTDMHLWLCRWGGAPLLCCSARLHGSSGGSAGTWRPAAATQPCRQCPGVGGGPARVLHAGPARLPPPVPQGAAAAVLCTSAAWPATARGHHPTARQAHLAGGAGCLLRPKGVLRGHAVVLACRHNRAALHGSAAGGSA